MPWEELGQPVTTSDRSHSPKVSKPHRRCSPDAHPDRDLSRLPHRTSIRGASRDPGPVRPAARIRASSSGRRAAAAGAACQGRFSAQKTTLPPHPRLRSDCRSCARTGPGAMERKEGERDDGRDQLSEHAPGGRMARPVDAHARPLPGVGRRAGVPPLRRPGALPARRPRRLGGVAAPALDLGRRRGERPGPAALAGAAR